MRVLIAGSHGAIGQRLTRLLSRGGHDVVAMIRDSAQADDMRALGGDPLVADLTGDVAFAVDGVDAVVFSAGAGSGSGPGPKETVDKGGAVKLIDAAVDRGGRRFVMVSSIRADDPEQGPEQLQPYLRAKHAADQYLRSSDLAYTIVRPGRLTDEPGDGRVTIASTLRPGGSVSRDDVAAVVAACLTSDGTIGQAFDLLDGATPISEALEALTRS